MLSETLDPSSIARARKSGAWDRADLLTFYRSVRTQTEELAGPLTPEDAQIQSMPDVSPSKWHLAHTSWFFETFLLDRLSDYETLSSQYRVLYNSYYNAVGDPFPRPERGLISRPSLDEVRNYRRRVDEGMARLIESRSESEHQELAALVELGLNHEEQHQELMLTDILHVFSCNPLRPVYASGDPPQSTAAPLRWHGYEEGEYEMGHDGPGFAFDNEGPRHRVLIRPFELASRPVSTEEYLAFMDDGGYRRPELWLSDGWLTVQEQGWQAPLYWERDGGSWNQMTLYGLKPLDPHRPLCHLSYYEADAFARWAGARLPTEAEWELAAGAVPVEGNLGDKGKRVPVGGLEESVSIPSGLYGDVWEWTQSAYSAYPGFRPNAGAIGEYNGKFMCNQLVLRGGSFATALDHIRPTYRNFFPPSARWQFMGARLARDA